MTPSERILRGRVGGFALAARRDPKVYTAPARAAFMSKFLSQVDPDGVLPLAERERRATAARSAHFARMALKSAQSRRKRKSTHRGKNRGTNEENP